MGLAKILVLENDEVVDAVVYVTSPGEDEAPQRAASLSPHGHLLRPFDEGQLRSLVELAAQRHYLTRALRRAEQRYEAIFRSNPAAILVSTAREARIQEVNQAFVELFGWEQEEVVGRTVEELEWWADPNDRQRVLKGLGEEGVVREVEVSLRTRTGELRVALISADLVKLNGQDSLLALFQDITERRRAERKLEHLALHDPLTGLPNRTLFHDRLGLALERARRERGSVSVLFVDLDRFKRVNDTLGHAAGDELLRAVGDRLEGCLRKEDTVARLGGDEFAAVLESEGGRSEARSAARRIVAALRTPFQAGEKEVRLSASVGIAVSLSGEGRPEEMVRFADAAMYRAKDTAGLGYQFFDPVRDAEATKRLHRERELREALARDEFTLLYRPVVHLRSGRLTGCEALLRWRHPERGLLAPPSFVPLAEDAGLIVPIGERVMERAFRDVTAWMETLKTKETEEFRLSVNLTPRQLQEPQFVEKVRERMLGAGMSPGALQVEITEGLLPQAVERLRKLRGFGFRLAITDFGTGYSSLHDLKEMDVDVLKVHGSFTRGVGQKADEAILRSVTQLGHALGMEVLAEGVETRAQHRFLRDADYDFGQGTLYSAPLPAPSFQELLARPDPPYLA